MAIMGWDTVREDNPDYIYLDAFIKAADAKTLKQLRNYAEFIREKGVV